MRGGRLWKVTFLARRLLRVHLSDLTELRLEFLVLTLELLVLLIHEVVSFAHGELDPARVTSLCASVSFRSLCAHAYAYAMPDAGERVRCAWVEGVEAPGVRASE